MPRTRFERFCTCTYTHPQLTCREAFPNGILPHAPPKNPSMAHTLQVSELLAPLIWPTLLGMFLLLTCGTQIVQPLLDFAQSSVVVYKETHETASLGMYTPMLYNVMPEAALEALATSGPRASSLLRSRSHVIAHAPKGLDATSHAMATGAARSHTASKVREGDQSGSWRPSTECGLEIWRSETRMIFIMHGTPVRFIALKQVQYIACLMDRVERLGEEGRVGGNVSKRANFPSAECWVHDATDAVRPDSQ